MQTTGPTLVPPPSADDTLVLKIAYPGLGDHLFCSHLPRIARQTGRFRKVLISSRSDFRHPDYRRLIWEANPFVDGFTERDAPALTLGAVAHGTNLLDAFMLFHKLDDGRRMHEPEFYWEPPPEPLVEGATVYDPNFVSFVGGVTPASVDRYLQQQGIVPDFMLSLRGRSAPASRFGQMLETASFEHYCSIIRSAGRFVCLTSGGATLAAALGKPATALWGRGQNPMFHHSPRHTYVNVNPSPADRAFPRAYRAGQRFYLQSRASLRRCLPASAGAR